MLLITIKAFGDTKRVIKQFLHRQKIHRLKEIGDDKYIFDQEVAEIPH